MEKIYAKTLNPEFFDYRVYDIEEDEGNEVIIDGCKEFYNVDKNDDLKAIKGIMDEYNTYSYDYYYKGSIMAFLNDMLPKKKNGKKLSPAEANAIRKALDEDKKVRIIITCLSVIYGKKYHMRPLRGCCQGEYVEAYYPEDTDSKYLDYVEAWFFGTGTEVLVYDGNLTPESADDIEDGWTFYTASWKIEDIKNEIRSRSGASEDTKVVLYEYTGTKVVKIDQYKLAE